MQPPLSPTVPMDRARAARVAVSVLFFANGAMSSSVLPRLPAIRDALDLSKGELGTALAAMAVGGLLAGGLVGILIARFGSGRVAIVAGVLATAVLAVVGLAFSWATLALAYLVLGMFDATLDAAMNSHGIGIQRVYRRSILQGFHGMWSVGGVVGSFVGALAAAAGVPVPVHLLVVAIVLAVAILIAGRSLLPAVVADAPHGDLAEAEPVHLRALPRLLRVLLPIAMLGILCVVLQSSAASWSAVFLTDVLHAPAGVAAAAFTVYMAAMVLGRLTNDAWVNRFGSTAIVRVGAVLGALGLVAVIGSAPLVLTPLAFVGFALVGLGSSPMFPVMIGAAGSRPGIPAGHGVALVSWLVRIGLIAAPAVIGGAADVFGLVAALGIPFAAAIAIALLAPVLSGGSLRRRAAVATGAPG